MNKFKCFFTFAAFFWLWGCGFLAIQRWFFTGDATWCGLLINAWALPIWMLLRYLWPGKFSGDLRETPAFTTVLIGLAIVLLTDTDRGAAIYLAIYNLFVLLVYLFHLSSIAHPKLPDTDNTFPQLKVRSGDVWSAGNTAEGGKAARAGSLLIFLRGRHCADSRHLLVELSGLVRELDRRSVQLVLIDADERTGWQRQWISDVDAQQLTLDPRANSNRPFVAAAGAPLWEILLGGKAAACRPSAWLLDREGYVVWRHLPGNYRVPGGAELLRGQLFRLDDEELPEN